jgi:hypothetical protein
VIATLVYLALQIGHSNEIASDNSAKGFTETVFELSGAPAMDRQFAEIWNRGHAHFAELDEVDQQRLILHESRGLDLAHLAWQQRNRGLMADVQWKKVLWNVEHFGQRQAIREAWTIFRSSYDAKFQDAMDPYFAKPAS